MVNVEVEFRARRNLIFLAKFSKELEEFSRVIEELSLEKEEIDKVREHVETLQEKVGEWIDELSKFLDAVSLETEHFIKEEIEKYVKELEMYIEHSNRILQTVMNSIDLTPHLFKAGDSVVMNVADAEDLIRLAILKTVDVMLKGEVGYSKT